MRKNKSLAGLDMKKTLQWYDKNATELSSRLPPVSQKLLFYPLVNHENIQLLKAEMAALIALFPVNAIKRSILKHIVGKPPTWFHRKSTVEEPITTTDVERALSPTAIVPSFTSFAQWKKTGLPSADIWLYSIRTMEYPFRVKRITLSESLIHEFGHTIIAPASYIKNYALKLPDDRIVKGLEYIAEFAKLAENHPPISHYASTYRGRDNKFEGDSPKYNWLLAIGEELAETIAAYLLRFAFCGDEQRNWQPLADRLEIKTFVEDFLNAKRIK